MSALGGIQFTEVGSRGAEARLDGDRRRLDARRHRHGAAPADPAAARREASTLELAWNYRVPPDGAPRGGQDRETYLLCYWYPQVAVYDDVNGWQVDQYLGNAEFYMGYADYDVALTVPAGWLVASTGELQNADEVLVPAVRERLARARGSAGVTTIVPDRRAARAGPRSRAPTASSPGASGRGTCAT